MASHTSQAPSGYPNSGSPAYDAYNQSSASPSPIAMPSPNQFIHQVYQPVDYITASTSRSQQNYSPSYSPLAQAQYAASPLHQQASISQRYYAYSNSRPSIQSHYSPQYAIPGPPPLPAISGAGDSPTADWGILPSLGRYQTQRYPSEQTSPRSPLLPSPPPNTHSRTSSAGHSSPPYSPGNRLISAGIPPLPPPHHSGFLVRNESIASRPLPHPPPDDSSSRLGQPSNQVVSLTNGHYDEEESDDDDPESIAGLRAFEEAERQEAEENARRTSTTSSTAPYSRAQRESYLGSDYVQHDLYAAPVDLSQLGGGWDAPMSLGADPNSLTIDRHGSANGPSHSQTASSSGSSRRSGADANDADANYPYGSGGLYDPNSIDPRPRRMSFDENDEAPLLADPAGPTGSVEPVDLFYHPGMASRPLPQPPSDAVYRDHPTSSMPYQSQNTANFNSAYPPHHLPQAFLLNSTHLSSPPPGRHTSLVAHSSTPSTQAPARAVTDAERRRRLRIGLDNSIDATAGASAVTLGLPELTKRYNPSHLRGRDFDLCTEPWALSSLATWLQRLAGDDQYLKKQPLVDGLVALFVHKVPTMNTTDAETLADRVIEDLKANRNIIREEEWLMFKDVAISGVLYQLTGTGCYAPLLHSHEQSTRCYAHHCQRTERKIDLSAQADDGIEKDWVEHWGLSKGDLEKYEKRDVARQNVLHEIIQKEENYIRELRVLLELFRDGLAAQNPPVIPPRQLPGFLQDVFGKAEAVKKINEEYLLPQLKYQQSTQGPWIVECSSSFRAWIRKAKTAYIEYASSYPQANYKVRHEMDRNMLFKKFLSNCQNDPRSRRLDYNHYLKLPITRLQQLVLLMESVLKASHDNEEKRNFATATEEIRAVTVECDSRVGEGGKRVQLVDLQAKLKLRQEMRAQVNLNLDHLGRELIHEGDILRMKSGISGYNGTETHAILFDNFLVLAKSSSGRDNTIRPDQYDVSCLPIPMKLLILESDNDDPVRMGFIGVSKVEAGRKLGREATMPIIQHSATSISFATTGSSKSVPTISATAEGGRDDNVLYPFKVKHLGKENYILYAHNAKDRDDWCSKIIEAKTKHAQSLFAEKSEPFRLKVIADTAFAYDSLPTIRNNVIIKGTPLDRAIREVESKYVNSGRPSPICYGKVSSATSFLSPTRKPMIAIGTDYGVYIAEEDSPRSWHKVIANTRVSQVAVIEEFSVFLLISEKSLICHHLDMVCPIDGVVAPNNSLRQAAQKLSGNRDVGFFATARMKDRTLVFYKKKDVSSSTFKVLEPVLQRSTEKKSRLMSIRSGKTDFFRDFDDFYIPTECIGMNIFHSSISISTMKGFEILNLDRKQPASIPTHSEASHTNFAQRIKDQRPRGMFRLNDQEFLLCFEYCALYVNKQGDISRSAILEFVGHAQATALFGLYVLIFDKDFVEIRNAMNGQLKQVITGRDIKCLDTGEIGAGSGKKSVKISMMHPENERNQLVIELVLND